MSKREPVECVGGPVDGNVYSVLSTTKCFSVEYTKDRKAVYNREALLDLETKGEKLYDRLKDTGKALYTGEV